MNNNRFVYFPIIISAFVSLLLILTPIAIRAQDSEVQAPEIRMAGVGTAFTYQGRLTDNGAPANGSYNFRFYLWSDDVKTTLLGAYPAYGTMIVDVVEGYFKTTLDFGIGIFDGNERWLEIEVNGVLLSPLQPLTPTPYAIYAQNAPWNGIDGMPVGFADGIDNDTIYTAGYGLNLQAGEFSVDTNEAQDRVDGSCPAGQSIRVINQDGSVTCETDNDTTSFWSLNGNSGTNPLFYYIGTSDNQALVLRVNATHALRLEPTSETANIVGGDDSNSVTLGVYGAAIGGGGTTTSPNLVTDIYGTVGGGLGNQAGDNAGTTSDGSNATVGGGYNNTASGYDSTIGGGESNSASETDSTVGGGFLNVASGSASTISGGDGNIASGTRSVVGGGFNNTTIGLGSTVSGGLFNTISQDYATIGGGYGNSADGYNSTLGGGAYNATSNRSSTVGGGESNVASGQESTVSGGYNNTASGYTSTNGGGESNVASGYNSTISGGYNNAATYYHATIGGGENNESSDYASTVGGGEWNFASGANSTVGGGYNNTASGSCSSISGGKYNDASGYRSTVGGGEYNDAGESWSTVSGGYNNAASGEYSSIPGGRSNEASGNYSFAAGRRAVANDAGAFVWADSTNLVFDSRGVNTVRMRATGGFALVAAVDEVGNYTWACSFYNGTSWSCSSDRNMKENFQSVDNLVILEQLSRIPLQTWNAKGTDSSVRHLGPTAQDFYSAFKLGEDDTMIATIDLDGVALAAIQGLYSISQEQAEQIYDLQLENASLRKKLGGGNLGEESHHLSILVYVQSGVLLLLVGGFTWVLYRFRKLLPSEVIHVR